MIFDPNTQRLYGSDGRLIARIDCPSRLGPRDLQRLDEMTADRYCDLCERRITNVTDMTESEFRTLIREQPNVCIFSTGARRTLIHLDRATSFSDAMSFRTFETLGAPIDPALYVDGDADPTERS